MEADGAQKIGRQTPHKALRGRPGSVAERRSLMEE